MGVSAAVAAADLFAFDEVVEEAVVAPAEAISASTPEVAEPIVFEKEVPPPSMIDGAVSAGVEAVE